MKGVLESIKNKDIKYNTKNYEGAPAVKMSLINKLNQFCMTATLSNTFYVSQPDLVGYAFALFEGILDSGINPKDIADAIINGRNNGYMRTVNIVGLTVLSILPNKQYFKYAFPLVIKTGNDLEDFINIAKKYRGGLGRSIKTTVNKWIDTYIKSLYLVVKYRKQLANVIRLTRPKTDSPVYDFIMKSIKHKVNIDTALENYDYLNAFEYIKNMIKHKNWDEVLKTLNNYDISPVQLLGQVNPPNNVWVELSKNMGTMMFLKYLNKLDREKVFNTNTGLEILKNKINTKSLIKNKVFPFRLYIAYINLTNNKVKNYLADVLDDYVKIYNWDKWDKNIVIAPDISGSMISSIGKVTPAVIAGMFSGILYKGIETSILLPWDTAVCVDKVLPRKDSVISHIKSISEAYGGGTFMEAPVEEMLKKNIKADIAIFITDSEEWGSGWLNSWIEYKKKNQNAKAVLLRVDPYDTQPFSDDIAEKYGIYQVFGWNDNVLKWIEEVVL